MTRGARILFGLLVVATVASFFVAQRLKNQPAVIQSPRFPQVFSPNHDGRRDTFILRFRLKRTTPVTVEVVDAERRSVATIARDVPARKYRQVRLVWDGKNGHGRRIADGRYKLKFILTNEGRSIVYYKSFVLDTTPPKPRVVRLVGSAVGSGPAILPAVDGKPVTAELRLRGWAPTARVVRTDPGPATVVRTLPVTVTERAPTGSRLAVDGRPKARRAETGRVRWDGTLKGGAAAPPGTYVIQTCVRSRSEILGCGPRAAGAERLPAPQANGRLRGNGGITVRPLGVQPDPVPVSGGRRMTFFVDARGARYRWTLRRVGARHAVSAGRGTRPVLKIRPGATRGAAYRLTVSARGHRVEVPALVNHAEPQRVLVVLPAITWQGLNPLDDDGDGLPNVLTGSADSRASRIRARRVMRALPSGFDRRVQPVLQWLARHRKRFELTTDLALAQGQGPKLDGHRGVLLVGQHRWTTTQSADRLRAFVRDGGTVAVLDPSGLRRSVRLTGRGARTRLTQPGPVARENVFGLVSRGAVRLDGPPQNDQDDIDLFSGTDGRFSGYPVGWPLEDLPTDRLAASAVDGKDRVLIAAVRRGKGLVIRTGLPTFAARLGTDADTSELMDSVWRRLSR